MSKLRTPLVWSQHEGGCIESIRFVPSPNYDERPTGENVSLLVIHAISLPPGKFGGDGVEALFTNSLDTRRHPYYREIEGLRVSSHFFIRRGGELVQFVPCDRRAWHAGVSIWHGRDRCNDFSIGIELEGSDDRYFETAQYETLNLLIAALKHRHPVAAIVGHSDISPGRKTDPGPHFDWSLVIGH